MMYKEVTKIDCDSKKLFEKRDEDGYIILDDKISEFTPESRERIGSEFRLKNWIETNDGKQFLVKSNNKMDEKENYTEYAELISRKVAQKMGLEYANYDIMKFNGQKGVITENMLNKDEYLITLQDIIDSEIAHPDGGNSTIDYPNLVKLIDKNLSLLGYEKEDIDNIKKEFKKRVMFDSIVGATDRHPENISFVLNTKDSKSIKLSPIYDTENSLLLENAKDIVLDFACSQDGGARHARDIYPMISFIPNKNAEVDEIDMATFEFSTYSNKENDYELEDFAGEQLIALNPDEIIKEVEDDINAPLPYEVSTVVRTCLKTRINEFKKIMCGEVEVNYDEDYIRKVQDYFEKQARDKEEI